jgi:hypothetical protein
MILMDSKQFDELVARLANAATRRDAVKGVVGGALASVGVTSVASAHGGHGKGKAKGKRACESKKNKARCNGKCKNINNHRRCGSCTTRCTKDEVCRNQTCVPKAYGG